MKTSRPTSRPPSSRRSSLRLGAALACALLLAIACGLAGRSQSRGGYGSGMGQQQTNPQQQQQQPGFGGPDFSAAPGNFDMGNQMTERRVAALNVQRQKQMVSDSTKLLNLARELNDEVAAANDDSLNGEQLRKLSEIEKLARGIKQRMVDGAGRPPTLGPRSAPLVFSGP